MNVQEKQTTSRCNKLHELPTVVWRAATAWCPDCDYYDGGMCNSVRRISNAACPFDGKLPRGGAGWCKRPAESARTRVMQVPEGVSFQGRSGPSRTDRDRTIGRISGGS